jgi:hypothetical protein
MGLGLYSTLTKAGLCVEQVTAEAVVQTAESHYPFGAIVRAILPRILEHDVATEEEIDIDTLEERLAAEIDRVSAVLASDLVFSAWARKPTDG